MFCCSLANLFRYLWENFSDDSNDQHVISIALMVVAKNNENNKPWGKFDMIFIGLVF